MSVLWKLGFSRLAVRHWFQVPSCAVHKTEQKHTVDYSRVPNLIEDEMEEQFVCGFGPGGQSVNKTASCVVLKHLPTGLVVKCQQTRSQTENRKLARLLLQNKLDELYNGELSVSSQQRQILERKSQSKTRKSKLRHEMKKAFKERENLE